MGIAGPQHESAIRFGGIIWVITCSLASQGRPVPKKETQPTANAEASRPLPPAAVRALEEAAERRRLRDAQSGAKGTSDAPAKEVGGRNGPDPVRYGDWEKCGIASDF